MEKTLSKAAVEKVIQDQIDWWGKELQSNDRRMLEMEHRYKNDTCTLDGLILYRDAHAVTKTAIHTRLMELNDILNAIDRLG